MMPHNKDSILINRVDLFEEGHAAIAARAFGNAVFVVLINVIR